MNELLMKELEEKLNYKFKEPALLMKSLTHSSYANESIRSADASNERLEFLGDSLLGMTVALLIYNRKPKLSEGQMTKLRAELVCERSLAALAVELNLGAYLLLGRGEENGGGRSRPSILSDAFEAVIAAIYLDGGYEPIKQLITALLTSRIDSPEENYTDYKTRLQEIVQCKSGQSLTYELSGEKGPDHAKCFTVNVKLNDNIIGTGTGKSKKNAEQEAAKAAVNNINTRKEQK